MDALLIFGHSGSRRHSQGDIHYLSQLAPYHETYVLLPVKGQAVHWITHYNHYASAKENGWIPDIRRAGKDAAGVVAAEIEKRGLGKSRIGLVGTFFYRDVDALRTAFPSATFTDLSAPYRFLRTRKSTEELDFQRKAAQACDAVMEAMAREARPGVEERDLLVLSEEVAWREGCEPYFLYLNSTSMRHSTSCVPNQELSRRRLQAGDVINTELTVSYGMYCAQLLRPFFLGDPTPEYERVYSVLCQVHALLANAMKPGTTAQQLHEISGFIEDSGLTSVDSVLHGFGVDILLPNLRTKGFAPPPPFVLESGMTIVLQPNPTTADERVGMQMGETGLVTENGFASLHKSPSDVIRIN
ncbi:Xaa-Pro aminopeptidase [Variovorax sp. Sphag1AA]|nr:Xaa-Pro aminopeptidase [Variovorax sp. Sphag1AA]